MPTKNSTSSNGKSTQTKGSTSKKSSRSKEKENERSLAERRREELEQQAKARNRKCSILLFAVGVLLVLFVIIGLISSSVNAEQKNLLDYIYLFLCGIFGFSVFFTGPVIIYAAILIASNKSRTSIFTKIIQMILGILLISAAIQIIFVGSVGEGSNDFFSALVQIYTDGTNLKGGGLIGALLAYVLLLFGKVGAIVIILIVGFVFVMFISRKSLMDFLAFVGKPVKKAAGTAKEYHRARKEEMELLRAQKEQEERERIAFEREESKVRTMKELEAAGSSAPKMNLADEQKAALAEQNKASNAFLNELNSYNGVATNENEKVTRGDSVLPDIAYENDVRISSGKLPDLPNMPEEGKKATEIKDVTPEYVSEEKNEAQIAAEELPPPPENPPEEVNPVEQALQMYTESKEREQQEAEKQSGNTQSYEDIISDAQQYVLPPTTLLDEPVIGKTSADIQKELDINAKIIVDTLASFGVQTKVVGICRGPSVTRYEIQPAAGVKISKITGLVDDIAMNLASGGIRIEAPIPNKPAVGIEVPNKNTDSVPFRALIESPVIADKKSKLAAVLGKDISGDIIIADIAEMPHLLIAGTTGSGKSVCVNSIIMSILFRSTPEEVRFIMIDPKAVEFMIYNGIPHLLIPVVTDPKKAAGALTWAVTEMLRRYTLFSSYNVRNLAAYNTMADKNPEMSKIPQIVIFIDELADLIMASKNEVEDSICRLAQMARAAGMHLVIATQRPTVDVVTGLIKSNIPSRIALKVSSGVDSRTIIDEQGAEKLLGKGDMLFKSTAMPKPKRIQGCWISDKEVDRVVTFIKNSFILDYDDDVMKEVEKNAEMVRGNDKGSQGNFNMNSGSDTDDEKLEDAIRIVVEAQQASISSLQRALKLGFGRAARLIDTMEEMGIVGPGVGSKPREVLMTKEQYYERRMNNNAE